MNFLYDVLGVPFGYIMRFIYWLVSNYGVAIILFTVFSKLLLFPINYKTQKSSAKMQRLNPKLKKLREKYKNEPQKLQEAQMALYQEEGVNPGASCLPMFVQFFLLFGILAAIYKPLTHILGYSTDVIESAVSVVMDKFPDINLNSGDLRKELFVLEAFQQDPSYFKNLAGFSSADVQSFVDNFTLFGINLGQTPVISDFSNLGLWSIPFISGILQLIMTVFSQFTMKKRNPDQPNMGCMNVMLYIMPIFSVWFAFQVPAGVGFYWACSSFFSLIIQVILYKYFTPERVAVICEKETEKYRAKYGAAGKKSFAQKMMEKQNAAQQMTSDRNVDTENMSKKELNAYESQRIKEARRRMAEKYGDDFADDDED